MNVLKYNILLSGSNKKKIYKPPSSLPSCHLSAESRAAFAAAGSSPAGGQSSPGAGRCAPGNPSLSPGGWSSAVSPGTEWTPVCYRDDSDLFKGGHWKGCRPFFDFNLEK